MPQLDHVGYLVQFITVFISFQVIYTTLLSFYLPMVFEVSKFRSLLLAYLGTETSLLSNVSSFCNNTDYALVACFSFFKKAISHSWSIVSCVFSNHSYFAFNYSGLLADAQLFVGNRINTLR